MKTAVFSRQNLLEQEIYKRKEEKQIMEENRGSWLRVAWRIFSPLLLYLGIQIVAVMLVSFVLTIIILTRGDWLNAQSMAEQIAYISNMAGGQVSFYVTLVTNLIVCPIAWIFYRIDKKKRLNLGQEIAYNRASFMEYVLIAIVAFGACIGGNNLLAATGLPEMDTAYQEVSQTLYSGELWIEFLGIVVIAPLCEELLFRGLIYKRMQEYMTPSVAMVLSALAFGFFHGNMTQMVYAAILGFLMAYVYEKYHNLLAPILFHAVANLFSVIVTETNFLNFLYSSKTMMLLSGILGIAIVIVGIRMMREMVRLEPKDPASRVEL